MQEARDACRPGTRFGSVSAVTCNDHDRGPRPPRLDVFGHLKSAHAGHADVAVNDVVFFLVKLAQCLFPALGGDDGVTLARENTIEALADDWIVVDNEHFA